MGLWVSFAFGALLGVFLGVLIGRARAAARGRGARAPSEGHAPTATPVAPPRSLPPEIQHVVLDEGSANVLNALTTASPPSGRSPTCCTAARSTPSGRGR